MHPQFWDSVPLLCILKQLYLQDMYIIQNNPNIKDCHVFIATFPHHLWWRYPGDWRGRGSHIKGVQGSRGQQSGAEIISLSPLCCCHKLPAAAPNHPPLLLSAAAPHYPAALLANSRVELAAIGAKDQEWAKDSLPLLCKNL